MNETVRSAVGIIPSALSVDVENDYADSTLSAYIISINRSLNVIDPKTMKTQMDPADELHYLTVLYIYLATLESISCWFRQLVPPFPNIYASFVGAPSTRYENSCFFDGTKDCCEVPPFPGIEVEDFGDMERLRSLRIPYIDISPYIGT